MTRVPVISIVTPTRNRRTALERAIASVQAQTLTDYEHLIIDDASTDGTADAVPALGDPRIRFTRFSEWQGANPARNAGIAAARAPLVTFLDSDDEFLPQRLEHTVQILRAEPELHALISSFSTRKGARETTGVNPAIYLDGPRLEHILMAHALFIAGSAITVRRDALTQAGGFAPHLLRMQDREMLLRLSSHCGARVLAEVDWIKHRSPDSISAPRDGYLSALGALLEGHPELVARYPNLVGYLVARHLLSDLLSGRWRVLADGWRGSRGSRSLAFSVTGLIRGYVVGKRERKALAASLRQPA